MQLAAYAPLCILLIGYAAGFVAGKLNERDLWMKRTRDILLEEPEYFDTPDNLFTHGQQVGRIKPRD